MPPKRKRKEIITESETQIKVNKKVTSTSKTSPQVSKPGRTDSSLKHQPMSSTTYSATRHQATSAKINSTSTQKTLSRIDSGSTHQATPGRTDTISKHHPTPNARITRESLKSSMKIKTRRTSLKSSTVTVRVTRGFLRSSTQSKTDNPRETSSLVIDEELKEDKNPMLLEACQKGSVEIVRDLLASGADINHQSTEGWTPIMCAVDKGHKKLFDLLAEQGCDMSLKLDNGSTILHLACAGNNKDIVNYIISHNVESIESKGMDGHTPVMEAASVGNKTIFDLLVSHGCDLKATDDMGNNILHFASLSSNVDIVSYILSNHVVDINSKGRYERTPVMTAAGNGQKHVFDFLVRQGCDMKMTDKLGYNILHLASFGGNVDIVSYILSNHIVDINSRGEYGRTPVMTAAESGHKHVFDFLVSQGCDLTMTDENNYNILHLASFCDDVDVVSYILSHDIADINSKEIEWSTPVMFAAENGQKHVFDFLVSQGCDLTMKDQNGDNILHLACFSDNVDIVAYILSQNIVDINSIGAKGRTPLMTAAETGQKLVFDFLISQGCDLSITDENGYNILHLSCFSDNVDIVGYILSHNIVDINSKGFNGRTPVMAAAKKGHKHVFHLLVNYGCDLTMVDHSDNNILHVAAAGGSVDIVKWILSKRMVDINCRNNREQTALEIANGSAQNKVASLLVDRGAVV